MARKQERVNVTINRDMRVALEVLAAKSNLGFATQAMVMLRQALDRTIQSDAVQLRIKQEETFRTRDEWLRDQTTNTFVTNALSVAEGDPTNEQDA